jgi:hypothetical protein
LKILKYGDVNPLAVFGLRRVAHCPPHFVPITFDRKVTDKVVIDWIYENTVGRFYFGNDVETNKLSCKVAFESGAECMFFALQLTEINAFDTALF